MYSILASKIMFCASGSRLADCVVMGTEGVVWGAMNGVVRLKMHWVVYVQYALRSSHCCEQLEYL